MKNNIIKNLINAFIMSVGLSSCSSSESDYIPAIASTLGNNVFLSIEKKDGKEYDCKDILLRKVISIYGNESKEVIHLGLAKYNGKKVLNFNANLPDRTSMKYNSEKTEGHGHSDMTISFKNKNTKIRFYYKLIIEKPDYMGMNAIYIDSIECKERKIKPKENSNIYVFTLKENTDGELIIKPK